MPSLLTSLVNCGAFEVTCMFPPLLIRCLCRCIHLSGFPAVSSLFFSSLCLICGFLPTIAKTLNSLFRWLALRLCLSRFPRSSFPHYKAVFFGEHLLFSLVPFYLACPPPPTHTHFSQSVLFFHDTGEDLSMLCIRQEETHFPATSSLPLLWTK